MIFMNLLVGLTVSSIDELKRTGTIMQDMTRVDDILSILQILPDFLKPDSVFKKNVSNKVQNNIILIYNFPVIFLSNSMLHLKMASREIIP